MRYKDHMATSWASNKRINHDEVYEIFESVYQRRSEGAILLDNRRVIVFEPFLEEDGKIYLNLFGEFKIELEQSELESIRIAHEGINFGQSEKIAFILEGPDVIGQVTYLDEEGMKIYEERRKNKKKAFLRSIDEDF